jgi:ATP-binding cassette subfamily B protein
VLKNIRELKDKTVVIVTHRPAALEICNRKVEIINKKIQER